MEKKKTNELLESIKTKKEILDYINQNKDELIRESLSQYLNRLLAETGKKRSEIVAAGDLPKGYTYELFSGEKTNPSRDMLIKICFGFGLDLEQTQTFLKRTGAGVLYPRNKRDSVIIFAIENKLGIVRCNMLLEENGEILLKN
ncbi:MAG: XRE family transcriptional regulator [Ruminiclostridium sp.]